MRALITLCILCAMGGETRGQLVRGRPPLFTHPSEPTTISTVEGQSVVLTCSADLADGYEWRLSDADGKLLSRTSSFELNSVRNDFNKYRCVARNSVATSMAPIVHVQAKYLDDFDHADASVMYELTTSVGRSFILRRPRLIASLHLNVTYSWFKDELHQITSNSHFVTSRGDLVVAKVNRDDFGTYKVVASSEELSEIVSDTYTVSDDGEEFSTPTFSIVYISQDDVVGEAATPREEFYDCVPSSFSRDMRIVWFRNGVALAGSEFGVSLKASNKTLAIVNPSGFSKDLNKLECRADDTKVNVSVNSSFYLTFKSKPSIRKLPTRVSRPVSGNLNLKCSAKKSKAQWYFNGRPIKTNHGRLVIESIVSSDYGLYQCEATNEVGVQIVDVWLKEGSESDEESEVDPVDREESMDSTPQREQKLTAQTGEGAVGPTFSQIPAEITLVSGTEQHTLECSADGYPTPRITWLFNGNELASESLKHDIGPAGLTIHNLHKSDEGEYVCEATNSVASKRAIAFVHISGDHLIEYGPADQKSLIGTNVEFSCQVVKDYERKALIEWYLNDELISPMGNSGLRISRSRKGSLIIRQVGPDNIGEYKCVVNVDGRSESASAMLRIIEKPAMPVRVRAELHNETMPAKVRVSWAEGFDGNEPIIKHAIEMRTLGPTGLWSDWSTIIDNIPRESTAALQETKPCCWADVEDLRPSTTAEFRVIASNKHGPGKPSLHSANVTMPQQPPSAAPRGVAASAKSSHSIIVQWQQPLEEQSSGDVLGFVVRYRLAGYSSLMWNEKNLTTKDARNAVIDELITWREYEVQVAAYNKRGLGVFSESIEVTTAEGVPTQAPKEVRARVINSTAVEVNFLVPDQQRIPGVNLGYKVEFWKGEPGKGTRHREELLDPDRREQHVVVGDLEKFGHYNLTVLCYTSPGDGPRSTAVVVVTDEDVPGPVDELTVVEVVYNGAIVAWNQPIHANGRITKYTVRHWATEQPDVKTKHEIDGSQQNFTIDGLQPSTNYGVDVMASTRKGDGPAEETRFQSGVPPELPGRPTSLSITDVGARSVDVHFSPGFDGHTAIRQWIVEAKVADGSVFTQIFNISAPKARSLTVTNLRPYTLYQLRLIAENVKGRGAPSEPTRAFETLQTNPESASTRLIAEPVSATSISLSWTPLLASQWNGQPKGYLIQYREAGEIGWKEVRTPTLRASEYTLTDLRPFTNYELNVFAENIFGQSRDTEQTQARTYESVPSGSPRNVRADVEGAHSVVVRWEPVAELSTNGDVLGYKVRLVPEREALIADESREVGLVGQSTFSVKVTDLRAFTNYHVFVSAYTIVGFGPENSSPTTFETLEDVPSAPEGFQCSYVNENEVRLKWLPPTKPNGKIMEYKVSYWKSVEMRSMAIDAALQGNLLMFSATSLLPNTQYTFTIRALNAKGESEEVNADVLTTSNRVAVRNAQAPVRDDQSVHASDAVTIRWGDSNIEDLDAPVRLVQVSYQRANENDWTTLDKKFNYQTHKATVKRLFPNSRYRFRIRYFGDFLESPWSAESDWLHTLPTLPVASPIGLQATPYESTSVLLQWTVPHKSTWNSDAVGYRISYRVYPSNDSWQTEEIAPAVEHMDKEQAVLKALTSFRHYIVRMSLYNSEGDGPFSIPTFVYVGFAIPKKNVTNLIAEPLSSTSIAVRWDAWREEETEAISFKVRYVPVASVLSPISGEEEVMIVDSNSCMIKDLRKFTEYQISVSPYNRAGEGNMAQLRTKTLEDVPGRVGDLKFTDVLLDSVRVSWDPPSRPNGVITGYVINYKGYKMQEEFKNEEQKRSPQNFFVANGLTEGVTYYFIVWAETAVGRGEEQSANVSIGASKEGPPAPSRPVVVPGQSSVAVQWKDVTSKNVIGHMIQAKRVSAAVETNRGYVSQRPRRSSSEFGQRPTHVIGVWVTLRTLDGTSEREHITYRELQPASFYVFRVFTRNIRGVGVASAESDQLFVPEFIPDDPFYTSLWFLAIVAMAAFVCIVIIIAVLCITGSAAKYRREKRTRSVDSLQLADGSFATFQLKNNGGNITRSRELPTRPGTTQSWLSDREPPTYGSVLGERDGGQSVVNMYGLATDVIPALPNAEAMQRLSQLVGRDVGGGSGYVSSMRGSDQVRNEYACQSDYASRSDYGRVEYASRTPVALQTRHDDYDSFDDEESVDGSTIRGDAAPMSRIRRSDENAGDVDDNDVDDDGDGDAADGVDDIARHYGTSDECRNTWRRVRDTEAVRGPTLPSLSAGRASSIESGSDSTAWATQQAPSLTNGFSSFV